MGKEKTGKVVTRERILSSIGLAYRASLLTSGSDAVEQALRAGAVELLILAEDGSERQKEKLARVASQEETEVRAFGTNLELGKAIGRDSRIAIAILDEGFAGKLMKMIDEYKSILSDTKTE
ncbi:MAG: ribosomal L7Ae/L30e/S12e/Gadd45 family protein [Clostridiales bacterium]|nr:ribosomal L7Ae/L30e/S12e/Gadd45 family protein [Clostridiales bacterium]